MKCMVPPLISDLNEKHPRHGIVSNRDVNHLLASSLYKEPQNYCLPLQEGHLFYGAVSNRGDEEQFLVQIEHIRPNNTSMQIST